MIISHRHRFIFLHIPKTAGTALRDRLRSLDPDCEFGWDWGWAAERGRYVDQAHVLMRDLEASAYHRRLLREYFSFAVIRDPYERFASGLLEHLRQRGQPVTAETVRAAVEGLDPFRVRFDAGFIHLCPMHEFTHLGVRRRFDHLLRFEHLEEDLAEMSALLGLDGGKLLPVGRVNVTNSEERSLVRDTLNAPDLQARITAFYEFDWRLFGAYYPAGGENEPLAARAEELAGLAPPAQWQADRDGMFLPSLMPLASTVSKAIASERRASELAAALKSEQEHCAALEAAVNAERKSHGETQAALEAALDQERKARADLEAGLAAVEVARAGSSVASSAHQTGSGWRRQTARLRRNVARELRKAADLVGGRTG